MTTVHPIRRRQWGIASLTWGVRCEDCGWKTEARDESVAVALGRKHECQRVGV